MSNFVSTIIESSSMTVTSTCLNNTVIENIADKKINKINNIFLFTLRKLFNLST